MEGDSCPDLRGITLWFPGGAVVLGFAHFFIIHYFQAEKSWSTSSYSICRKKHFKCYMKTMWIFWFSAYWTPIVYTVQYVFIEDLGFLVAQMVKNLPAMWETWVLSLGREDPLEREMATHSSILAWRILWTEEPGRLQTVGLSRVVHD